MCVCSGGLFSCVALGLEYRDARKSLLKYVGRGWKVNGSTPRGRIWPLRTMVQRTLGTTKYDLLPRLSTQNSADRMVVGGLAGGALGSCLRVGNGN